MRRTLIAALLLAACGTDPQPIPELEPTPPLSADLFGYVDPFIGTGGLGDIGSTYPGPAVPFGMIHPGPDTRLNSEPFQMLHCSGYWYDDDHVAGFSLTRMNGTGTPDYGTIALMPVDGMTSARTDEPGYSTAFDKAAEEAEPGFYRVTFDNDIAVEITASERAASFRFTFPRSIDPVVLLDFEHAIGDGDTNGGEVTVDPETGAVAGWMHNLGNMSGRYGGFRIFAHARFDPQPTSFGVWDEAGLRLDGTAAAGTDLGAWVGFLPGTREVVARVAISFVDDAGARSALAGEMPDFDFDAARSRAAATWREAFGQVELRGASARDTTVFATSLYHALLMPSLMSDVDGRYRRVDDSIAVTTARRYSDFSLWDTYRTLHPWLLLVEEERNADFAASLTGFGREGGGIPRWSLAHGDAHAMIGDPGVIVLAESALKGVSFSETEAYGYAQTTAYGPSPGPSGGRGAIVPYVDYGYVPADLEGGSVSKTLEYVAADLSLANWADHLGETGDADALRLRAEGAWRALFDPESQFFWGLNSDGTRVVDEDPHTQHDLFTEGNAWQYLWMLPNDPAGLAELLGGEAAARARLTDFFENAALEEPILGVTLLWYWHGNEPVLIAPWLFSAWGAPAEAARWVQWAADSQYDLGPDGLAGNDDGGTLSAWYLFASAGIYPIAGSDLYLWAAPRQRELVLHRPSGDLTIEAEPDPIDHPVPVRLLLDGVEVTGRYLRHADLVGEHTLHFEMTRP